MNKRISKFYPSYHLEFLTTNIKALNSWSMVFLDLASLVCHLKRNFSFSADRDE